MRTRIKVCCIASPSEASMAIEAGADALGLVARMPSGPGTIADATIAEVTAFVPPPVATFLLTCETTAEAISAHVRTTNPSTVQVVSHIDPAESEKLAALEPHVRRVQVIHVEGPEALDLIPAYAPHVHAFLLDSGRPSAAVAELGGTGRAHDWAVSAAFVQATEKPVFLAGGLSAANNCPMTVSQALSASLNAIGNAMAATRDPWWIIASAAVALHGADPGHVADVDVLLSVADARRILPAIGIELRPGSPHAAFRSSIFGIWTGTALPVEFMADFQRRSGEAWLPVRPATRQTIKVEGVVVFVPERTELQVMLAAFGRPKDMQRARSLAAVM